MSPERPLHVALLLGSTREGRACEAVARWFVRRTQPRDDLDVEVVDLADHALPDRYPRGATAQVAAFASRIDAADAVVVVVPEYNRSYPAATKQAIDLVYDEWRAKPVGFVAYGCGSPGLYPVEHLRSVFGELHAVTMRDAVHLDLLEVADTARTDEIPSPVGSEQMADRLLDQLTWWGSALRDARARRPYLS